MPGHYIAVDLSSGVSVKRGSTVAQFIEITTLTTLTFPL